MINWLLIYYPELLAGIFITLQLMLGSLVVGFIVALLFACLHHTGKKFFTVPINVFVFFIRSTPLLVQLFLIYYGAAQFSLIRDSFLWPLLKEPFICALIGLGINSAAYTTVVLKSAMQAIPRGEIEAAKALGLSPIAILKHIILPRTFIIIWPSYTNEMVLILKATALASTITLLDIMGVTRQLIAKTYDTLTGLLVAGLLYVILTLLIVGICHWVSRRFKRVGW